MRKMIAALLLAAAALTTLAAPTPAQAVVVHLTASGCVEYEARIGLSNREFQTCFLARYTQQADGTGVRVGRIEISTPRGCSDLESADESGAYSPFRAKMENPNTGERTDTSGSFYPAKCAFDFPWEYPNSAGRGPSSGAARLTFNAKARVDGGVDKHMILTLLIRPNGTYVFEGSRVSNDPIAF